ncbi:MAG: translocase ftsK [Actinomycetia bacterium]|nr:translocase ftsK [Actinomycetes bacterium]
MQRRMRRDGNPYGVFIVGPAEPLAVTVIAGIARWAFRHRSGLAPFNVALTAFVAAGAAHWQHPGWWVPMTAVTAVTVALLGFPYSVLRHARAGRFIARVLARAWAMCGIDRAPERAYAATVIAALGAWLAAATANGPLSPPLPWTLITGTVILGIPWWAHRRRRARVRVQRKISAWPELSGNAGLADSRISSVVVDAWGWTARVILRKGDTPQHAIAQIPEIESALGTRPGSVHITPDESRADALVMRVTENDPHADSVPWPGTQSATITRPVPIGVTGDGRPVSVLLLRRHALIAGTTGSGKSGILSVIIATLAASRDVVLWGVDLKGGMELQAWEACFDRNAMGFRCLTGCGWFLSLVTGGSWLPAGMPEAGVSCRGRPGPRFRLRLSPEPDGLLLDEAHVLAHARGPPQTHPIASPEMSAASPRIAACIGVPGAPGLSRPTRRAARRPAEPSAALPGPTPPSGTSRP